MSNILENISLFSFVLLVYLLYNIKKGVYYMKALKIIVILVIILLIIVGGYFLFFNKTTKINNNKQIKTDF